MALTTGQPVTATRGYLHTLVLPSQVPGAGHASTRARAEQAVYAWTSIPDRAEAHRLGMELLAALLRTVGQHDKLARHVSRRLTKLQAGG
ncbi:hypothetical protein [Actinacidiphila acidipaludis]|uniref:Uncharacterized protein n=1 Tax=Actinacidiphila acidipaludis TaxID=2873382 RepID=A0ABS7QC19_9ACTN|nr:hypothetical protein [Streptomyces acidipaludis]MBY8880703.1 hypothetical protein [Streptomyces acidipaludis]